MTPQEQNIAIAKACPSRFKYFGGWGWHYGVDGSDWMRCVNGSIIEDLNAMHEAEKVLENYNSISGDSQYGRYITALKKITAWYRVPCATAEQRAEAFGLTLGLWKHGE